MESSKELARLRADIARAARQIHLHPGNDSLKAVLSTLRSEYAEKRIADHVETIVAKAPPLTPEQRDRLAILLRAEPAGVGHAA